VIRKLKFENREQMLHVLCSPSPKKEFGSDEDALNVGRVLSQVVGVPQTCPTRDVSSNRGNIKGGERHEPAEHFIAVRARTKLYCGGGRGCLERLGTPAPVQRLQVKRHYSGNHRNRNTY